ncbi:MAG: UDP-N-acetylmuramoyl-tripeptide--D-alanyl-D-alanine ligase [Candidatus Daviesbacteria bacterium]|nr:MAG: UDP-N-acetylmuramoyl-tripeptide--D-alanyl-D-alanine ligase [Candidatus Daviesbacteria bacterium]
MDISSHPIWTQVTPYQTRISVFKKPFHLIRIFLARQYAKLFSRQLFVGVTGSVGKTTCVLACQAVLSKKFPTLSSQVSLDPILNIPLTILKITPKIKKVILEMGIEYPGEMDFYLSLVKPKTAIVTRIYFAHSEFLGGVEQIMAEKGKLVAQLPQDGLAILNYDDIYTRKLKEATEAEVIYFGTDSKNCEVWAGNIKIEDFKTIFELNYGVERVRVEYQLLGEHQVYPALAAAALGISNGVPLIKIKNALESMTPADHRLQPIMGPNNSVILDDTYNSSPAAACAAIDTLMKIPARRKIIVLGEMKELGKYSDDLHREIARKIYREKPDLVLLGGGSAQIIAEELKSLGFWEQSIESNLQNSQIVAKLLKYLGKGDVCLIKGSRSVRLDEVVARVAKK